MSVIATKTKLILVPWAVQLQTGSIVFVVAPPKEPKHVAIADVSGLFTDSSAVIFPNVIEPLQSIYFG